MESVTITKPEVSRTQAVSSRCLHTAVLDSGRVAFEFQQAEEAMNSDRREIEKYLYETCEADPSHALLALGLADPSFGLSPSLEFWRGFCALFVHALLVAPETEERRERMRVELMAEDVAGLLARVPAMTGGERVNAGLLEEVWDELHHAFALYL